MCIRDSFKAVFAASFCYDEHGRAEWPATAVNYTSKTQYLFRINKGILDVTNDRDLNAYTPEYKRRVPFSNMIYVGDGLTDVPCMKMTKQKLSLIHICSPLPSMKYASSGDRSSVAPAQTSAALMTAESAAAFRPPASASHSPSPISSANAPAQRAKISVSRRRRRFRSRRAAASSISPRRARTAASVCQSISAKSCLLYTSRCV